ncbi:GroES-like protein [Cubamyces sp. BRFM 1775]|nr:GroES-like protein [Cubamyces sp. BRFM 1775]
MVVEIPTTMRAAVYHPGNLNPVTEHHFPVPQPGHGQVLLKVAACGACHSDVLLLTEALIDERTYILGHEISGYPVKFGDGVVGIEEGQLYVVHVIVPCTKSTSGLPPLEESDGIGRDGGYAEYIVVDQRQLIPVPEGLAPELVALAGDSLITTFNAVHKVAELRPGTKKRVLIYGVGGLGHQALQIVKSYGATVFAVDYKRAARELAVELGAERVLSLSEITSETAAGTFTVDIVIDFVANEQSFALAKAATKDNAANFSAPASKIVLVSVMDILFLCKPYPPSTNALMQVGASVDNLPLNSAEIIEFNMQVLPACYGSIDDLRSSLQLLADGIVKPVVHTAPLERIDEAINALRASAVLGRRVIVPGLRE